MTQDTQKKIEIRYRAWTCIKTLQWATIGQFPHPRNHRVLQHINVCTTTSFSSLLKKCAGMHDLSDWFHETWGYDWDLRLAFKDRKNVRLLARNMNVWFLERRSLRSQPSQPLWSSSDSLPRSWRASLMMWPHLLRLTFCHTPGKVGIFLWASSWTFLWVLPSVWKHPTPRRWCFCGKQRAFTMPSTMWATSNCHPPCSVHFSFLTSNCDQSLKYNPSLALCLNLTFSWSLQLLLIQTKFTPTYLPNTAILVSDNTWRDDALMVGSYTWDRHDVFKYTRRCTRRDIFR